MHNWYGIQMWPFLAAWDESFSQLNFTSGVKITNRFYADHLLMTWRFTEKWKYYLYIWKWSFARQWEEENRCRGVRYTCRLESKTLVETRVSCSQREGGEVKKKKRRALARQRFPTFYGFPSRLAWDDESIIFADDTRIKISITYSLTVL